MEKDPVPTDADSETALNDRPRLSPRSLEHVVTRIERAQPTYHSRAVLHAVRSSHPLRPGRPRHGIGSPRAGFWLLLDAGVMARLGNESD